MWQTQKHFCVISVPNIVMSVMTPTHVEHVNQELSWLEDSVLSGVDLNPTLMTILAHVSHATQHVIHV